MTDNEYLKEVLKSQELASFGNERKILNEHSANLRNYLLNGYGNSPIIIQGGSVTKGTLIKSSYDLDIHFYFSSDDTTAGDSLEEIYNSVASYLKHEYDVIRKRTALRLRTRDDEGKFTDLCIDVVPGRYQNGNSGDVFLYQNGGDKSRLKTNIQIQIETVKQSGLIEPIRLMKLWNFQENIGLRTFILELLVIEILKNKKGLDLDSNFITLLSEFKDNIFNVHIEDPANKSGNDLGIIFDDDAKSKLSQKSQRTFETIRRNGIKSLFDLPTQSKDKLDSLFGINKSENRQRSAPWYGYSKF